MSIEVMADGVGGADAQHHGLTDAQISDSCGGAFLSHGGRGGVGVGRGRADRSRTVTELLVSDVMTPPAPKGPGPGPSGEPTSIDVAVVEPVLAAEIITCSPTLMSLAVTVVPWSSIVVDESIVYVVDTPDGASIVIEVPVTALTTPMAQFAGNEVSTGHASLKGVSPWRG